MAFYAHSANSAGNPDLLVNHLRKVAERAAKYASVFDMEEEARLAGLLHDVGKYGDRFRLRLENKAHGVDHWSAGAWFALTLGKAIAAALAIEGHHIGLQKAQKDCLLALDPGRLATRHPYGLLLSESNPCVLQEAMKADGIAVARVTSPVYPPCIQTTASAMLDVRMLYSALVDADFIETEAHFKPDSDGRPVYRPEGPALQSERAYGILREYLASLSKGVRCSGPMAKLRSTLLNTCVEAGSWSQGLYTLTAPTGSGKTLSMLAFALRHAATHNLRRIVVVIPFLTIIEQTARIYADLFKETFGENYVLEDHSLVGTRPECGGSEKDKDNENEALRVARLLAENWDAPIIVTTSVQFLESLFSNSPSACRKLHRLARSVILFDEVQALPADLAIPTLATLARLSERYGATIVFATASQPAFSHLDPAVRKFGTGGWQPKEIVNPQLNLFTCAGARTCVHWPAQDQKMSWEQLAQRLSQEDCQQVLCIVNLKAHAQKLVMMLKEMGSGPVFHLSTYMCPAHRQAVLTTIRELLQNGKPCRLISTQCVEAGVDVDFPVVYRAWGPLEAIAQAAGRCNRNGTLPCGNVYVFIPDLGPNERYYPPGGYEQAADAAKILLKTRNAANVCIESPEIFLDYYKTLYDLTKIAEMSEGRSKELRDAIHRQDFAAVARLYRVVDQDAINILVPYDEQVFQSLCQEARSPKFRLSTDWIRRARPYTVSLYRPKQDNVLRNYIEPVHVTPMETSNEWFIYLTPIHYDMVLGLVPPSEFQAIV